MRHLQSLVRIVTRRATIHCRQCTQSISNVGSTTNWTVHPLASRGVVRLEGTDTIPFLQGLVTNDVAVVGDQNPSLYTMMLNVQGRVLYDLLMYHSADKSGKSALLLECDSSITKELVKLMRGYKIRKKVDIADVSDDHKVFAALSQDQEKKNYLDKDLFGISVVAPDPRVNSFGWRLIGNSSESLLTGLGIKEETSEDEYHTQRYQSGIGEGVVDLPPGNCFPLESNAVYLNGVCFHKGCYIGQELTARTFHTGVTRKRLMPLEFEVQPQNLSVGANIATETGKSAGKVRGHVGKYGLGLLRIAEASKNLKVKIETGEELVVKASTPKWWPTEE